MSLPEPPAALARLRSVTQRLRAVSSIALSGGPVPATNQEPTAPQPEKVSVQPIPPIAVPATLAVTVAPVVLIASPPLKEEPVSAVMQETAEVVPPADVPLPSLRVASARAEDDVLPTVERMSPERLQALLLNRPPKASAHVIREEAEPEDAIDWKILPVALGETEELLPTIRELLVSWRGGDSEAVPELHRLVHTLKGTMGMAGAMRARSLTHSMETLMAEAEEGNAEAGALDRVAELFSQVEGLIAELRHPPVHAANVEPGQKPSSSTRSPSSSNQRTVRVSTDWMDDMYREINEARLKGNSLGEFSVLIQQHVQIMEENERKMRDVSLKIDQHFDSEMKAVLQSWGVVNQAMPDHVKRSMVAHQEQWQWLRQAMVERINDAQSIRQSIQAAVHAHDNELAHQKRSLVEVQDGMHKTRLTPVETWQDRLQKVVVSTAHELGKAVRFRLRDNRVELDRALLEKMVSPLEHVLRNAVTHGLEDSAQRRRNGKSEEGHIEVEVRQEAGRAFIEVSDDGSGLNTERIRQKAIEKGLWEANSLMDDKAAADMICRPGFSTADNVSQLAGRGVGMDVVRNEVLAMGGRFDLVSRPGKGLTVNIQLPTDIASASAMIVSAGGEDWVLPIEIIERVFLPDAESVQQARQTRQMRVMSPDGVERNMSFIGLDTLLGVHDPAAIRAERSPVLMLREGERYALVEVDSMNQVTEVALQPLGRVWADTPGLIGSALLPNGQAAFLVDPLRAPWESGGEQAGQSAYVSKLPIVLVVDDSVTVRQITSMFLEKHGYVPVLASHGREALEILARTQPHAVFMDMEMPIMDGIECTRTIRQQPQYADLPILMITTKTGEMHKKKAQDAGITDIMGKPFHEDSVLEWLTSHAPLPGS
jgi:chemosensory pili system protein ChpA (sensor histidine kinase/response regulator)